MIIRIKESFPFTLTLTSAHLGGGLAAVLSGLSAVVVVLLLIPIGLSLVVSLRLHSFRNARSAVTAFEFSPTRDGSCRVFHAGEADGRGCRVRTQFVTRFGVVLTIANEDQWWPRAVVIPANAVNQDDFRQLRVYLRLAPPAA